MRRLIYLLLLLVLPGYSQTTPSTLTLHTLNLDAGGEIVSTGPSAGHHFFGSGAPLAAKTGAVSIQGPTGATTGYNIFLSPSAPKMGQIPFVSSTPTATNAYLSWLTGYNGKAKVSATCTLTITNGIITGVNGC